MSNAGHEAGATAEGKVEPATRFSTTEAALANVTKVAQIRATAAAQVEHLDERLTTAIAEAREAGATAAQAKAAAKTTQKGDHR